MFLKFGKKNITSYAQNYSLCFYLVHAIYSDQNASIYRSCCRQVAIARCYEHNLTKPGVLIIGMCIKANLLI